MKNFQKFLFLRTGNLCLGFLLMFVSYSAQAALQNMTTAPINTAVVLDGMPTQEEQAQIRTLENDIDILDAEITKCEKKKKGWIAATVIGGVGTVSTATAAIVQGVQISKQKQTINDQNTQLQNLQQEQTSLGIK